MSGDNNTSYDDISRRILEKLRECVGESPNTDNASDDGDRAAMTTIATERTNEVGDGHDDGIDRTIHSGGDCSASLSSQGGSGPSSGKRKIRVHGIPHKGSDTLETRGKRRRSSKEEQMDEKYGMFCHVVGNQMKDEAGTIGEEPSHGGTAITTPRASPTASSTTTTTTTTRGTNERPREATAAATTTEDDGKVNGESVVSIIGSGATRRRSHATCIYRLMARAEQKGTGTNGDHHRLLAEVVRLCRTYEKERGAREAASDFKSAVDEFAALYAVTQRQQERVEDVKERMRAAELLLKAEMEIEGFDH